MKVDASWTWAGEKALPGEEREGNFGHFFYSNEKRMPPCGPPISEPEMGGRGDVAARHESGCLLDMGGGKGFAWRREGGEFRLLSFTRRGTNALL